MQIQKNEINVNFSAIILSTLIGIGILATFFALAFALRATFTEINVSMIKNSHIVLLLIALAIGFIFIYFFMAFSVVAISSINSKFNAFIHSFGTWSLLSIFIVCMASMLTTLDTLKDLKPPLLETSIHLKNPVAMSKITPQGFKKKPEKKEQHTMIETLWWTVFLALLLGGFSSALGGKLAFKKHR